MDTTEALLARLTDLREGPGLLGEVAAHGDAAVPGLETILRGRTDVVVQPRCLAADALRLIGGPAATDALVRALDDALSRQGSAELIFAEETVASRIARNLGLLRAFGAMNLLLRGLDRHLLGCVEALARIPDQRALPSLVDCLADDYVRSASMETLRLYGSAAIIPLTSMVANAPDDEGDLSARARASAAELLGELNGPDTAVLAASKERQPLVRRAAAVALLRRGKAPEAALILLIDALEDRDLSVAETAEAALLDAPAPQRPDIIRLLQQSGGTGDSEVAVRGGRRARRVLCGLTGQR